MNRWITALTLAAAAAGTAPAAAQDVVYTKQPRFRIPYHSDPSELQRLGAREVQLYVSTDRGLNWRLAQSVPPTAGKFGFEAPSDGEYWFSVRTVDASGKTHPPGATITPGLKVAVDTRPPDLALALERSGPQVRLSWRASDVALDAASLKLEFLQPGMEDWQPVHVIAQAAGQTAWTAPSAGVVAVRGLVQDRAGNAGSGEAELQVGATGYAPLPANPSLEGPIADADPSAPIESDAVSPFRIASERSPGVPGKLVSDSGETPLITGRNAGPRPTEPTAPADPAGKKVVNTRSFNLNYQVDEVGPSGVGQVEFFITEDGGRKWFRYGNDDDLKSPFRIDVPQQGTYGFQVRVRSGAGLADEPPKPGDPPTVTVVVDETPPVVRLDSTGQARGDRPGTVQIRWSVEDANPAAAGVGAIDIEHATSPQGPWTPIAKGIENTGSHDWTAEAMSAAKVFIRVTARDAAGNIGHALTAEPVVIDLLKPTARITDVGVEPIK